MKNLHTILYITTCLLLLAGCKEPEPVNDPEYPLGSYSNYTYLMESVSDFYVQVADSIYHFNYIEGSYWSHRPTFFMNNFMLWLSDSSQNYQLGFFIFTKEMAPEIFFQKGSYNIDTLYINNNALSISELFYRKEYYGIRSIFIWDTVFYENKKFNGKGSFEIMDTLFTSYPTIYYPPQKIEFEFK